MKLRLLSVVLSLILGGSNGPCLYAAGNQDTLQMVIRITNMMEIGWGTKYKCEVISVEKGVLAGFDSAYIMSIAVGMQKLVTDIVTLVLKEPYFAEFIKTERKTDKPYLPAGTTGLMDKDGVIWRLIHIEKADRDKR